MHDATIVTVQINQNIEHLVCPGNDVLAANDSHGEEKTMIFCFLVDRHVLKAYPLKGEEDTRAGDELMMSVA